MPDLLQPGSLHTLADLEARYGRILIDKDPRGGYKIISPIGWENVWMKMIYDLPGFPGGPDGKKLYVNRDLEQPLRAALTMWQQICPEYVIKTIGCFCPRYKRTATGEVSVHTFGLAIDINAATNPLSPTLVTDMPPEFVKCFTDASFTWGGSFKGMKDSMHMQLITNY